MRNTDNPLLLLGSTKDTLRSLCYEDPLVRELVMTDQTGTEEERKARFLTHCLDTDHIPDTVTDGRTLLCMETGILSCTETMLRLGLTVTCYTKGTQTQVPDEARQSYVTVHGLAGNRMDMILMAVYRLFSSGPWLSAHPGIGDLRIASVESPVHAVLSDTGYYGKSMMLELTDFHTAPGRRRKGQVL